MTPRVFISSTYYDLRHVRERLERFVQNYGFEPVLFESDKVTYEHGKPLDSSAYREVSLCHIMVLIIGGRYGTIATQQKNGDVNQVYEETYVSITRKELTTAIENEIPVYVFVDKNVYSEYQTYKENLDFFNNDKTSDFKFAHVDDVRIFHFIDAVKTIQIKSFEKVEEIELYLKNQLSGLFYLYLESLKKRSNDNRILNTITELNSIARRMDEMLNSVGKEVLAKNVSEYEKVINRQLEIIIHSFIIYLSSQIDVAYLLYNDEGRYLDFSVVKEYLVEHVLDTKKGFSFLDSTESEEITKDLNNILAKMNEKLSIQRIDPYRINQYYKQNVKPFIEKPESKKVFNDMLTEGIKGVFVFPF